MPVFASDDFNGSFGTNISTWNPAWVQVPDFTSVILQIQTTQGVGRYQFANYFHSAVPPSADYSVRATFRVRSATGLGRLGLSARMSAAEYTQYRVELRAGTTSTPLAGSMWLYRINAGTLTELATKSFTIAAQEYAAELRVVGDQVEFWLDGVQHFAVTDPSPITDAGHAGIYQRNYYTQNDFLIDDFVAESLAAAPERQRSRLILTPW
jgi:hypothetical protein